MYTVELEMESFLFEGFVFELYNIIRILELFQEYYILHIGFHILIYSPRI